MKLKDKVAVITGAGSGIGRETAKLFAQEGAYVVVADVNKEAADETCSQIPSRSLSAAVDVSKAKDIEIMYQRVLKNFGRVDIVYNNAGVPMSANRIEDISEDMFDKIMDVNLKGVFLGCKYAVPIMKNQGTGGVIINTASIAAVRPRPGQNVYATSKGAVITLTRALASELAPFHIRVVAINPVAVDTPMFYGFIGDRDEREARESYISSIPLGRLALPQDIARAALYLASEDASLVTGTILDVDGGRGI